MPKLGVSGSVSWPEWLGLREKKKVEVESRPPGLYGPTGVYWA